MSKLIKSRLILKLKKYIDWERPRTKRRKILNCYKFWKIHQTPSLSWRRLWWLIFWERKASPKLPLTHLIKLKQSSFPKAPKSQHLNHLKCLCSPIQSLKRTTKNILAPLTWTIALKRTAKKSCYRSGNKLKQIPTSKHSKTKIDSELYKPPKRETKSLMFWMRVDNLIPVYYLSQSLKIVKLYFIVWDF